MKTTTNLTRVFTSVLFNVSFSPDEKDHCPALEHTRIPEVGDVEELENGREDGDHLGIDVEVDDGVEARGRGS